MKKKKILIISIIIVILVLSIIGALIIKNINNNTEEKKQSKIVENTKKKYAFFTDNKLGNNNDDTTILLNSVIEESNKNEKIDSGSYISTVFSTNKFNNENIDDILNIINNEIELYKIEYIDNINESNLKKTINDKNIDQNTLVAMFNSHKFVKNISKEKEKRTKYIDELNILKEYLIYFKEFSNDFYIKNNKIIAKNDEILNKLNEFNNKYKLNLIIEKESVVSSTTTNNISSENTNYITILCYHGVLDNPWGLSELFVKVDEFDAQMKYLSDNGYTTLFASQIAEAEKYEKPVIITFDDGYADVYNNAFPILKKYNLKANVYMISGWINGDVYMTSAMTKEMSDSPLIEIGSHTVNHKALATLSDNEIDYELKTSKEEIEKIIGKNVDVIAYPTGSFDSRVINIASQYYKYALSTVNGFEYPNALNTYSLKRKYVYRKYNINQFASLF